MTHLLRRLAALIFVLLFAAASAFASSEFEAADFSLKTPSLFVKGVKQNLELTCHAPEKLVPYGNALNIVVNGAQYTAVFDGGTAPIPVEFDRKEPLSLKAGSFVHTETVHPMPLWWSVVPPLLVIVLALVFREVLGSLLAGIFLGGAVAGYYMSGPWGAVSGFFRAMDVYLVDALFDRGHISVVIFSVVIGGIVALISKNGGMQAVVDAVARRAHTPAGGQGATWLLGIAVFFDDYANTLVVGNTMRSVTDRLRVSREKLAYIVDSTAAPVAATALITTWIGAELGYIEGALNTVNAAGGAVIEMSAYAVFLHSLQYAYYPFFALVLILFVVYTGRDYGPMYAAERRARAGSPKGRDAGADADDTDFAPEPGAPLRKFNALLPIGIVVFGTVAGLFITGHDSSVWADPSLGFGKKLSLIIGNSDSYRALIWASISGLITAVLLTAAQGIMSYGRAVEAAVGGFKTMVSAVVILLLAWALAALTEQMHTADYLAGLAGESVAPWAVPVLTFVLAAAVAFSTGSAWGTMAIVYPLMLPLSWELSIAAGLAPDAALHLFFNVTSCVLAGAVLGDHCSPISDTTILSSLATGCHHMDHVRTQLPYALTAGGAAAVFTLLSASFGLPWYLGFPLGFGLLWAAVRFFGKKVDT